MRGEEIKSEDQTEKAKVTLKRELTEVEVRPGDFVRITDVVINSYMNTRSLQTTQMTKVEKCDSPLEKGEVSVEAIGVEKLRAELHIYLVTGESVHVLVELVYKALNVYTNNEVEMATALGPLKFDVELRGSETVAISRSF